MDYNQKKQLLKNYDSYNWHYKESYEILKKYANPKRLLSFVDASLIFLTKNVKARVLLSFDNHFDGIISRLY